MSEDLGALNLSPRNTPLIDFVSPNVDTLKRGHLQLQGVPVDRLIISVMKGTALLDVTIHTSLRGVRDLFDRFDQYSGPATLDLTALEDAVHLVKAQLLFSGPTLADCLNLVQAVGFQT